MRHGLGEEIVTQAPNETDPWPIVRNHADAGQEIDLIPDQFHHWKSPPGLRLIEMIEITGQIDQIFALTGIDDCIEIETLAGALDQTGGGQCLG
jgi:hypothetical protein